MRCCLIGGNITDQEMILYVKISREGKIIFFYLGLV